MKIDLNNKVLLVTGASRGIGAAVAKMAGQSGGSVAVHANSNLASAKQLAKDIGNGSEAFEADLGNTHAVIRLYHGIIDTYGRIDVLINNAGIAIHSPLSQSEDEWINDWHQTLNVNLLAAGILCKLTIPNFKERGSGIIINISSRAAHRGDTPDYLAYAASKGGMESLTKSIARAYGKDNITAFGVAPGFTRTAMAKDFIDTYGEDYAVQDLALSELTEPQDVAQIVLFLASGLGKHATGTTIDVNAGSYVR
ncbi:MAG: SDR family oxidoreductase [Bacteroidota bacterium]